MVKRFLALLLTLAMLTALIPAAFAEEASRMVPKAEGTVLSEYFRGKFTNDINQAFNMAYPAAVSEITFPQNSGEHVKWIDRVNITDTGKKLYDMIWVSKA